MAKYLRGVNILRVVGGDPIADAASKARAAPQHIVVGTPGRVQHMIEERIVNFDRLRLFILDEADEMLSQGFNEVIVEINSFLPKNAQTILLRFVSLSLSLHLSSSSHHLLPVQCYHAPRNPGDYEADPSEPRANPGSTG
jgi:hypothetical protein